MRDRIDWLQWAYASVVFIAGLVKPMLLAIVGPESVDAWQAAIIAAGVLLLIGAAISTRGRAKLLAKLKERRLSIARALRAAGVSVEGESVKMPVTATEHLHLSPDHHNALKTLFAELEKTEGAEDAQDE
ncbi:MAG: hypothetical protein ICCCNLDF_01460 [Planctomycetes bacterium]|nr:hypothetical protein [Planctomycetota bacterium]